jgi:hypothetical protein
MPVDFRPESSDESRYKPNVRKLAESGQNSTGSMVDIWIGNWNSFFRFWVIAFLKSAVESGEFWNVCRPAR